MHEPAGLQGEAASGTLKYRMYVDEVGNSDMKPSHVANDRYLSLSGVIIDLDYVTTTVFPNLEQLKTKYFGAHPDEPIVLHRKELVNHKPPFEATRDPQVETEFNGDLLDLLRNLDYVVITAVIDKLAHLQKYKVWQHDPYHYCLMVLVERFTQWLNARGVRGDAMAESRGGREDERLKKSYTRIYVNGTDWVAPDLVQARLTSSQLKVKAKANNIAGLQIADMVAHPSFRAVLARHEGRDLDATFGGRIGDILVRAKYRRSPIGRIPGFGTKWLP